MTIRERIERNEAANRRSRQEYMERLYSQGWHPPRPREDWKLGAAIAFLGAAVLLGLTWIQLTSLP